MSTDNKINHLKARVELLASERGKTLKDIAEAMGKSPQSLQAILERGNPLTSTVKELIETLGITMDELFQEVTPEEYGQATLPRKKAVT